MDVLAREDAARLGIGYEPALTPALQPLLLTKGATMALRFAHHVTTSRKIDEGDGISAHGTTVWVAWTEENECAALSFEWTELAPGVLCVANMLAVASNIYPIDEDGSSVAGGGRLVVLVTLVHGIAWHDTVRARHMNVVGHMPGSRATLGGHTA